VLAGGGARGAAHAGVIAALEQHGVHPDFVVGTSMGAFIGAAYARDCAPDRLKQRVEEAMHLDAVRELEKEFNALVEEPDRDGFRGRLQAMLGNVRKLVIWNRQAIRTSLAAPRLLDELATWLVGDMRFEDLQLPFYAVAFDLLSNRTVVFGRGLVRTAVAASAAIPGVFEPIRAGGRLLADGCVLEEIPTGVARALGADFVIAVDVSPAVPEGAPRSGAESVGRVLEVRAEWIREKSRDLADVVIRPAVSGIHWSEFGRSQECMERGEQAAMQALDEIRGRLRRARRRSLLGRVFLPAGPTTASVEVEEVLPESAGTPGGEAGTVRSTTDSGEPQDRTDAPEPQPAPLPNGRPVGRRRE